MQEISRLEENKTDRRRDNEKCETLVTNDGWRITGQEKVGLVDRGEHERVRNTGLYRSMDIRKNANVSTCGEGNEGMEG